MAPFDLAKFAPSPVSEFTLRDGRTYKISSDPDVDDVARMLRVENGLRGHDEDADLATTMIEGKQLLCELIRQVDPDADLDGFRVGAQEMVVVFSLILHGQSVAESILEAISGVDPADAEEEPPSPLQQDGEGGDEAEVAPLPSARRSPEPSSASDEVDGGLRATGTA